ncbi:MAG: type II toxin-antitoxin system RelE/ParE family toxin [Ktedonobacteraceae bacterium]
MCGQQSDHRRQWRDYQTKNGARPIKDFLLALPDEDRAAILAEMEHVREHGTSVARHLHKDIYEARTIYNTKAYRILFACEGRFHHVLLALDGFQKKTQQTPRTHIKAAEQRLADWRQRGKAKRVNQENERQA